MGPPGCQEAISEDGFPCIPPVRIALVDREYELVPIPDSKSRVRVCIWVSRFQVELGKRVIENVVLLDEYARTELQTLGRVPERVDGECPSANPVCLLKYGDVDVDTSLLGEFLEEGSCC